MQDLGFRCNDHPSSYLSLVLIKEGSFEKRLLCFDCLYSARYDLKDTLPLSIALNIPHQMLQHQKSEYHDKFFDFCELDLIKLFKEQIIKFELFINIWKEIKEEFIQQYKLLSKLQRILRKEREYIYEKTYCNQFRQLVFQLKEHQNQQSDQYFSHLAQISSTIQQIKKSEVGGLILQAIYKIKPEIIIQKTSQQLKGQMDNFFKELDGFRLQLDKIKQNIQINPIVSQDYIYQLNSKIEKDGNCKIKSMNQIYLGSRDGLNGNAFWSKVNGKKQLLMIFKSNNNGNYIFGGYSPCQWQSNIGWVQDDTLTSFLFSQTHNQIYPLKQDSKGCAIYCNQGQGFGPTFGGGCDIQIKADFNDGGSNIGHSYQSDQYKGSYHDYLFGNIKPNIGECEIYEIIFA